MQTRWLQLFEILATSSSVDAAARAAQRSPAMLVRAITDLEAALGTKLVDYGRDGTATLTSAGLMFRGQGPRLLAQFERAAARARDVARGVTGTLRIGLCEEAATPKLVSALRQSRAQLQDLSLQWHEMPSARLAGALRANVIDVALLLEGPNLEQLVIEPMWTEAWSVMLPRAHGPEGTEDFSAHDLEGMDLVMTDLKLGPTGHDIIRQHYSDLDCPLPVVAQCLSRSAMLVLTLAGIGATFVPASFQDTLVPAGSPAVMKPFAAPELRIFAAYREADPPGAAMQFLRAVRRSGSSLAA